MFRLEAPFPLARTTLLLPSPEVGNTRKLTATVQTLRAMDGTLYTYIKNKRGRRAHSWDFLVARDKYQEVKEFADLYASKLVRSIDHEGAIRLGYIAVNPLEFTGEGRAGDWPGGEAYRFILQFEERV